MSLFGIFFLDLDREFSDFSFRVFGRFLGSMCLYIERMRFFECVYIKTCHAVQKLAGMPCR